MRSLEQGARAGLEARAFSATGSIVLIVLAFALAFAVYLSARSLQQTNDSLASRAIAVAVLRGRWPDLTRVVPREMSRSYAFRRADDKLRSRFPAGTGFLAVPSYRVERWLRRQTPQELVADAWAEKRAAAFLAALGVAGFLAFRLRTESRERALFEAAILAFATPVASSLSQALWSQTGELVAIALALGSMPHGSRRFGRRRALAAGAFFGLAFLSRPTAVLAVPLLAVACAGASRAERRWALAAAAVCGGAVLVVNQLLDGAWLGAYGLMNRDAERWSLADLPINLFGVWTSPSRGLLWFFPVLFALPFLRWRGLPLAEKRIQLGGAVLSVALIGLTALYAKWWGGISAGPRLLAGLSIPIAIASGAVFASSASRPVLRRALYSLALLQAGLHVGLTLSDRAWDWNHQVLIDHNPRVLRQLANSQIAALVVPGWEYRPRGAYLNHAVAGGRSIDLRRSYNARYDQMANPERIDVFQARFTSTEAKRTQRGSLVIAPPGDRNVLRLCSGESAAIPVGGAPVQGIAVANAWRSTSSRPGDVVATVSTGLSGDTEKRIRLRDGQNVFEASRKKRRLAPQAEHPLAGSPIDPDAVYVLRSRIDAGPRVVPQLTFEVKERPGGCLFVFSVAALEAE